MKGQYIFNGQQHQYLIRGVTMYPDELEHAGQLLTKFLEKNKDEWGDLVFMPDPESIHISTHACSSVD